MNKVYEELDEAKAEIQELKAELRAKTDSLENLKKSHNAQANQIQEAKSNAEKLDQKLLQQADEISEAKLVCEDLKGTLNRKESIIKHLSAANDKLRVDCDDKFKKWDEEKRGLVLALEETNEKAENQKSHNAQANQIQEAKSNAEKLDQKLLQQADEISEAKLVCEDLKGTLNRKESIIKHLSAANDKLRVDCDDKFKKWDEEKRGLVLALEETNEKAENQEQQIYQYKQEIERLKGCLSVLKDKCLETEKKSKVSKELREREDMFQKLEEESRKVEDQLKWKKEKFKHLEEAHEKLRDQFKSSKKEWDMEKSTLLNEISSFEIKLDSQIRISEDLQHQLHNCHQALAHVESQKKCLEVEVSNLKVHLDDASNEYQDAILQLDCLNTDRDKDIADLRYLLKTKEAYHKESEYQIEKLERENQELRMSLKELQEAKIQEAGALYSQSTLRSKLRNLEQTHKECASTLKAKEAEWILKLKLLKSDLNRCQTELETKIEVVEGLQMDLERSHSSAIEMKLLNEEMSVMLLVLKQGISEAQLKLSGHKDEMDLISKAREEKIFQRMKQLEMKDAALICAQKSINEERENAACLMRQIESYGSNNELQHSLQNELDRHKEMLEESTMSQMLLKEKVLQMECDFKEQLKEIHDALDGAVIELDETICNRNKMEFELQIWKSIVERLKNDLGENQVVRRELENSLLAQVDVGESLKQEKDSLVYKLEEKERSLDYLQRHVVLLEYELRTKGESPVSSESDNVRYLQIIAEKDKILEELQKEVIWLEQESFTKEFESAVIEKGTMEITFEHEKDNLIQLMKRKVERMDELMVQVTSLEQQFTNSLTTFSSQLAEKQAEINLIQEACDKITASQILAALEIEEKKLMVVELEDEIQAIQQKLKLQDQNWSQSEKLALDTEVELGAKQLKVMVLNDQMETKLRKSDSLLQTLKMENRYLLENATRLSSERENMLAFVLGFSDKICEFSNADTLLMDKLRSMVQSFDNGCPIMNLKKDDGFLVKENVLIQSPTRLKKLEANSDTRSPFKELNLLEE